jgi:hypothetical protein
MNKEIKGFNVGPRVFLDPRVLPELLIVTESEAKAIADAGPKRKFVVTAIE